MVRGRSHRIQCGCFRGVGDSPWQDWDIGRLLNLRKGACALGIYSGLGSRCQDFTAGESNRRRDLAAAMSDFRESEDFLGDDEEDYCSSADESGSESCSHNVVEVDEDSVNLEKEDDVEEYKNVMKLIEGEVLEERVDNATWLSRMP